MRRLACIFVLSLLEIPALYSQSPGYHARAMATYKPGFEMIKISRMSDPARISRCNRVVLSGTVISVAYDNQRQITSFTLGGRSGTNRKFDIAPFLYERELPWEAKRALTGLIAAGKSVRVSGTNCAGSFGDDIEADEISLVNPTAAIRRK